LPSASTPCGSTRSLADLAAVLADWGSSGRDANARVLSRAAQLLTDEWTEIIRRDRSHPSVVAVPLTRVGAPEVAVEEEQRTSLVRAL
jgi:hypothetical protein